MVVVVRRRRRRPPRLRLQTFQLAFIDGLCAAFDGFNDGAWEAACKEAIRECGEFKGLDAHDVWIAWLTQSAAYERRP